MIVIGIDPGLDGAIAVVRDRKLLACEDIPAEDLGGKGTVRRRVACALLADLLRDLVRRNSDGYELVMIERVGAMPGQGVASVFSFGDTAGSIRGVVAALGLVHAFAVPADWKRHWKVDKAKDAARARASELFPAQAAWWARKCDHNRAEAALIARYGWETRA